MFHTRNPALLIVDVQRAIDCFSEHERSSPEAEERIVSLLSAWRAGNLPVIHVRHSSRHARSPYHSSSEHFTFKPRVLPIAGEPVVTKSENCAFIHTALDSLLKDRQVSELLVCGVLVNHSVDATIRVAAGLGYRVILPHDATAAFGMMLRGGRYVPPGDMHEIFVSNLEGEYCTVADTHEVLAGLPRHKQTRA